MWNQESLESTMGAYPCKSPAYIRKQIILDNTSPVQAISRLSAWHHLPKSRAQRFFESVEEPGPQARLLHRLYDKCERISNCIYIDSRTYVSLSVARSLRSAPPEKTSACLKDTKITD